MISNFIYSQPVKIYFGEGEFTKLETILENAGVKKAVIACGSHFAPEAGKLVSEIPCICGAYCAVEQNPQLSGIVETVTLAREYGADAVIGIGGGSSIDTAKFAAAIALGDCEAMEYYHGEKPFPDKRLKIIAVPTTAGTGSEVTQVSVVSNGKEKRTINNPAFMPEIAIVDPCLSSSVPPRTTMNTGLDAMAHALEGYWSINHQPISDLMAIEAVKIILQNLEKAYLDGGNMEARKNMAYASLLGGLSFALPKTAASHACSYPLSEDYHLPHGEACAFTLDSFVRINADERLEYLARCAGLSGTDELAERIHALKKLAGLKMTLEDLGDVDLNKLCRDCASHGLMKNNPMQLSENSLREMFIALSK